jgi:hypothetical protein
VDGGEDFVSDAELHANVRFQMTFDTDQLAALVVVSSAAKMLAQRGGVGYMSRSDVRDLKDAIKRLGEVQSVRIS